MSFIIKTNLPQIIFQMRVTIGLNISNCNKEMTY